MRVPSLFRYVFFAVVGAPRRTSIGAELKTYTELHGECTEIHRGVLGGKRIQVKLIASRGKSRLHSNVVVN
jgi:hypothetical protein